MLLKLAAGISEELSVYTSLNYLPAELSLATKAETETVL